MMVAANVSALSPANPLRVTRFAKFAFMARRCRCAPPQLLVAASHYKPPEILRSKRSERLDLRSSKRSSVVDDISLPTFGATQKPAANPRRRPLLRPAALKGNLLSGMRTI